MGLRRNGHLASVWREKERERERESVRRIIGGGKKRERRRKGEKRGL